MKEKIRSVRINIRSVRAVPRSKNFNLMQLIVSRFACLSSIPSSMSIFRMHNITLKVCSFCNNVVVQKVCLLLCIVVVSNTQISQSNMFATPELCLVAAGFLVFITVFAWLNVILPARFAWFCMKNSIILSTIIILSVECRVFDQILWLFCLHMPIFMLNVCQILKRIVKKFRFLEFWLKVEV